MIVNLSIGVRVDTDRLGADARRAAAEECESAGFPVDEENIAWFVAEAIASEAADDGVGCDVSA